MEVRLRNLVRLLFVYCPLTCENSSPIARVVQYLAWNFTSIPHSLCCNNWLSFLQVNGAGPMATTAHHAARLAANQPSPRNLRPLRRMRRACACSEQAHGTPPGSELEEEPKNTTPQPRSPTKNSQHPDTPPRPTGGAFPPCTYNRAPARAPALSVCFFCIGRLYPAAAYAGAQWRRWRLILIRVAGVLF